LQSHLDVEFGQAQARAYNDWCADFWLRGKAASSAPEPSHPCTIQTTWPGW
jgi:hypothetical protein